MEATGTYYPKQLDSGRITIFSYVFKLNDWHNEHSGMGIIPQLDGPHLSKELRINSDQDLSIMMCLPVK